MPSQASATIYKNFYYDTADRLITATTDGGYIVNYNYDNAGNRVASSSALYPESSYSNVLTSGSSLFPGQSIVSSDGRFLLVFQFDSNIVLYVVSTGVPLWNSGTWDQQGVVFVMQTDGNLVLYGPHWAPVWSSGSYGHPGAAAIIQTDGNFVIYASGGGAVWNTGTGGH